MSSAPEVVDVEALLSPIAGENPAGENLQYEGLHDQIREARRSDDTMAQGEWQHELKEADWGEVVTLATDALRDRTKDLMIGAWLAEGLVKEKGFVGLRDGLKVMKGLHEKFWDHVYPEIDEGDMEARANALALMDRQVAAAIKGVEVTKASGTNYNFLKWEESKPFDVPEKAGVPLDAEAMGKLGELRLKAQGEGKLSGEEFRKVRSATRRAFYESTKVTLDECWAEFLALDKVMDEKFLRQTPGLGELKKTLDAIRDLIDKIVKEKRITEPDPSEKAAAAAGGDGGAAEAGGGPSFGGGGGFAVSMGSVQGRADALRRLTEIADFFRKTEPHSPVSYLVNRAVVWGNMSLDAWLGDVIKDSVVLDGLKETLGMGNAAASGGGESSEES